MSDAQESWTSREALRETARERIRTLGVREVRRRGRRRVLARASLGVLLLGGVGSVALIQHGANAGGAHEERNERRAESGERAGGIRWVNTDWSIGERTGARSTGVTRWVSNEDVIGKIEWVGGSGRGG